MNAATKWAIPYDLNNFAAVAVEKMEHERAAKLLGAAESILEAQGASWPPDEGPHFQQSLNRVIENHPPDDFERVWRDGMKFSIEEAIRFALKHG
jgi:hypothetical protein